MAAGSKKSSSRGRKAGAKRTSVSRSRTVFGNARLQRDFESWLHATGACDRPMIPEVAESITHIFDALSAANRRFDATAWLPTDIDHLLDVVLVSGAVIDEDTARVEIAIHTALFLSFLAETIGWSGPGEDLQYCIDRVVDYVDGVLDTPPADLVLPPVSAADEMAALTALPVIGRLDKLLGWVGPGRPVTATGALKLGLVPEAAALFGVDVVTTGGRTTRADAEPTLFPAATPPAAPPLSVRSMWDLPILADCWTVAVATGLLAVDATTVRPGPAAALWHTPDADPESLLALRRSAVAETLVAALDSRRRGVFGALDDAAHEAVCDVLIAAFAGPVRPPAAAEHDAGQSDADVTPLPTLLDGMTLDRLDRLVSEGIVDGSDGYAIADPLKPAVRRALMTLSGQEEAAAPTPSRTWYTMKISLKDTRPPVWRRLVLDGDLTLADLHDAIQAAFDWDDSHLHEFSVGPAYSGGVVYLPGDQIADRETLGLPVAEESVSIAAALPEVGGRLTYLYDFGDDWIHQLRVEKITAHADGAPERRCLTGRGAAPVEDSGGPWGWADLVARANNPRDDNHEDARDWLGLAVGERLDPSIFNGDEVEARLRALFG